MVHTEQFEYVCPQCRKRTTVIGEPAEDTPVWCPKCEIEMQATVTTGLSAAAAANSPDSSSNKPAKATKATAAKKTRATAAPKTTKTATKTKKAAEAVALPPTPEYGEFRCGCCGFVRTVSAAEVKAGFVQRCPSCFVKLDWIKF